MREKNQCPFIIKGYVDFSKTRLLDENESFHANVRIAEAKSRAQELGLDLVCMNYPTQNELALCKIMDYGKWKYHNEKQKKKDKKEHHRVTKEIRVSALIDDHDIEHKLKHIKEFIESGDDVIVTMRLKGRQRSHPLEAEAKMNEIIGKCSEFSKEVSRKKFGSIISVRLSRKP